MTTETTTDIKELHPELHKDIDKLYANRRAQSTLKADESTLKDRIDSSLQELPGLIVRETDASKIWESGDYKVTLQTTTYKPTFDPLVILDAIASLLEADVIEGIRDKARIQRDPSKALKVEIPKKKDEKAV